MDNNKRLFVASLPWSAEDKDLADFFSQAGVVISAQVMKDKETGRSRGFGFVEMSSAEEAKQALEKLNGTLMDGRKVVINAAKPRPSRY